MNFKQKHPDFATIENLIHRARVERAVAVSGLLVDALQATARGFRKVVGVVGSNVAAERDRRAIEADTFLKRSVPRY